MTEAQKVVTSSKLGKKYVAKELVVVNTLKKFIIIGVVVGILCGMVIVFVLYYGSSKIKVCEETELTDKIENLGSEINPKQNIFEGIANKIFYSKRNREIKKKINVAKIKSLCQKKNVKEIGVIGIKEEQIKSYYISELDKNNIRMICVDDINSVENIECISGVDTVMFFEYLKETDYATVEKIVKFCNHRGIDILGYISVVK